MLGRGSCVGSTREQEEGEEMMAGISSPSWRRHKAEAGRFRVSRRQAHLARYRQVPFRSELPRLPGTRREPSAARGTTISAIRRRGLGRSAG
jgi:hypothetical protein